MTEAALAPGTIRVDDVVRSYKLFHERHQTLKQAIFARRRSVYERFVAVDGVSFAVDPGGAIGIVGENGSGKSTMLKVLAGILRPERGSVAVGGKIASLIELGAGFHPEFSGRDNVFMNASIFGLSRRETAARFDDIVAFAELERFIDSPVKTYSSGMQARLGFSVAVHVDPDVLLLDEVLAVGDAAFQRKCIGRILEFKTQGTTLVFISHDASAVAKLCEQAILLDHGVVTARGETADVLAAYDRLQADRHGSPVDRSVSDAGEWGTRRVTIDEFALRDGAGTPTTTFRSGSSLAIEVGFTAHEPVVRPVLRLECRAQDGREISRTECQLGDVVTGAGHARLVIEALPLHEGAFDLTATLMSADDTETYHRFERRFRFSVLPSRAGGGLVDLGGRWTVEAAVGSA